MSPRPFDHPIEAVETVTALRCWITVAANHPGTYYVRANLAATGGLTATTGLVRRMPRVHGWHALSVLAIEASPTTALLCVINAGAPAKPWPVPKRRPA